MRPSSASRASRASRRYVWLERLEALGVQEAPSDLPNTVVFGRIAVDLRRLGAHAGLQDGQGLWHWGVTGANAMSAEKRVASCSMGRISSRVVTTQ